MEIMHIPLSQLSIAKTNVRHGVKKSNFSHLMPTIRKRGILQSLLVRKNGEGWDTVELGSGDVDLASILVAAQTTASPWLLSEQDNSDDPWRSAENNFAWLTKHA